MSAVAEALGRIGSVIADGRPMLATCREAAHHGQWAEAAARLEEWAVRMSAAVESMRGAELPNDADELASIVRTVECTGRMYALVMDAANDAWRRAAAEGGAVA